MAAPSIEHAVAGEAVDLTDDPAEASAAVTPESLAARLDAVSGAAPQALARELRAYAGRRTRAADAALGAAIFRWFPMLIDQLRLQLSADEVTVASLPAPLRAQYVTADGRLRVQIAPTGDMSEHDEMRRFVDAVAAVAPGAAGAPDQIIGAARAVARAIEQATGLAVAGCLVLAALMLRDLWRVAAIIVPLVLAGAATAGAGVLLGLPFNYANVLVLPLLIGVGIDSGVHVALSDAPGAVGKGTGGGWRDRPRHPLQRAHDRRRLRHARPVGSSRHREHGLPAGARDCRRRRHDVYRHPGAAALARHRPVAGAPAVTKGSQRRLRVSVLVDLPRSASAGGHVKCWERLAAAAAASDLPLELTVWFSGPRGDEVLGPGVRVRQLPPLFSTARLGFLRDIPDRTDLAPHHPRLARRLRGEDVIHTTDGFFAFARTAEAVSRRRGVPLVSSIHTDTPRYARLFTRPLIARLAGDTALARWLTWRIRLPERLEARMRARLRAHLARCRRVLATREEDVRLASAAIGGDRVHGLRLGVDRSVFGPHRRDRAAVEAAHRVAPGRVIVLCVGRLDIGKNIQTLVAAMERLGAEDLPVHLVAAGLGPLADVMRARLGPHVSLPGFVEPDALATLFASADLLALPSEVETGSMVAVEALASGCPVLAAERSGIASLFHATPALRTVAGGADAWATAIRGLAADAGARAAMREAALAYGRDRIAGWDEVLAEDLLPVWRAAAGMRAGGRVAGGGRADGGSAGADGGGRDGRDGGSVGSDPSPARPAGHPSDWAAE